MTEKTLRKHIWESANYAGLALGIVSIIYMYISKVVGTSGMSTGTMVLITTPLWILKFAGCIFLMKFFMKKFYSDHPQADNRDIFRMGVATALLSAFFYSALQFIDMVYISPEVYTNEIELAMQQYSSVMDSNSRNMLKELVDNLPQLQFVWNLLYCFAFGTILSAILSRNIGNQDPFADYKSE